MSRRMRLRRDGLIEIRPASWRDNFTRSAWFWCATPPRTRWRYMAAADSAPVGWRLDITNALASLRGATRGLAALPNASPR